MRSNPELHYLDNAATTMVDPAVADAISHALQSCWANPSSLYEPAVEVHEELSAARAKVAKSLGCQPKELYFTACGSESNNIAIQGAAIPRKSWGNKIVVSGFEHPSVQLPIRALHDRGFEVVEILPEWDGHLDLDRLSAAVDKNTVLACCMAVNNETGAMQDIAAFSSAVKARNPRCFVHVDAVQAWLRIPIRLSALPCVDSLSVSGHKVHAPKGIGALFLRENQRQNHRPPCLGGHQERGIRPGTENVPYAVGLGLAAEQGARTMPARNAAVRALNEQLRAGLAEIPGITLNSPSDAVPEVLNFSTNCVNSQTMIEYLSGRRIYVSGGSACDKGEPSHTLMAMGCPELAVRTAIRVSFCADNTPEDVNALLNGLRDGIQELQHI
ncbi:MAG: cysteine desulfurase family protein [Oscillospiraceae bacterium]|nr:cysteine desulfurase family protein [Oscillospiraceae bacterium]